MQTFIALYVHKCSGLLHATTFVEYTHYISIYMWIVDGKSEKYGEKIALVVHIGIEALYKVMERKQKKNEFRGKKGA